MAIKRVGHHVYGSDGHLWEISPEAIAEKRKNWIEMDGVAHGYAYVEHSDWHTLYKAVRRTCRGWPPGMKGNAFLVAVQDAEGTAAHFGSIEPSHRFKDQLILEG
jgi:hypothetical protein